MSFVVDRAVFKQTVASYNLWHGTQTSYRFLIKLEYAPKYIKIPQSLILFHYMIERSKYFILVSMKIYQMCKSYSYTWKFTVWQIHTFSFCHDWLNYKHSLFMQWPSLTPSNIPLLMCTIMNYVSTLEFIISNHNHPFIFKLKDVFKWFKLPHQEIV